MSRIGKKPVIIPDGVEVKIDGQVVTAKGPLGSLNSACPICVFLFSMRLHIPTAMSRLWASLNLRILPK